MQQRQNQIWAILRYPGGVHLAGGDVGDVVPEGDGDVARRLVRAAEVDGDGLGDDHRCQHPGRGLRAGGGPAAVAPRKEGVGGDDHRLFGRDGPVGRGAGDFGDHLQPGQGDLPGKDLRPLDLDGPPARLFGGDVADGVGQDGGVALVEGVALFGRVDLKVGGAARRAGDECGGKAAARHRDGHPVHRGGLPGRIALDA